MSPRASPAPTTLRGSWLILARVAWVVVATTALAIIVFSVPSSFEHYSSVCTATSEVCSERARDQPTPEGVRALLDAGLSVRIYALLNVIVDKVFQLVWFVVGAHLLAAFERSDGAVGLHVSGVLRAGHGRYHECRSLDLGPASLVVARRSRGDRGSSLCRAVLLAFPRRTVRAALDALARGCIPHFSSSRHSLSSVVLSFARPGDDLVLGVPGHRGEPGLVADLFFPQSLLSGTTSTDQMGRLRHDAGHRGNLPLPVAGGPRPG